MMTNFLASIFYSNGEIQQYPSQVWRKKVKTTLKYGIVSLQLDDSLPKQDVNAANKLMCTNNCA